MNIEAKCECQHCGGHLVFPSDAVGQKVECPHCQCETLLLLPTAETNRIVNCPCQHCYGAIEFDSAVLVEESSLVQCPHCGLETKLFIRPAGPTASGADILTANIKLGAKPKGNTNKMLIRFNNDTLELRDDTVLITRRGFLNALNAGINGTRTIQIATLTAVQMKPGGMFTGGYILFSYAGSKPFMGGILNATTDPDAFLFSQELNGQIAEFKTKVEERMSALKKPATTNDFHASLSDEVRKLAELKNQGLLTAEEFEAAKKKLFS